MASTSTWALIILGPIAFQKYRAYVQRSRNRRPDEPGARPAKIRPFESPFQTSILILVVWTLFYNLANLIPCTLAIRCSLPRKLIEPLHRLWSRSSVSSHGDEYYTFTVSGGYPSDLFLNLGKPINISTGLLKGLLTTASSLSALGWAGTESELQILLGKLSSYEGRKLYLLLGSEALVGCTFCSDPRDYFYYALASLLLRYSGMMLVLGYVTTGPTDSIALGVNRLARLARFLSPTTSAVAEKAARSPFSTEPDRSAWRNISVATLTAMLLAEGLIMSELGEVVVGQGRWNHWHANLHLVRHTAFSILCLLVYLLPSYPRPRAFHRAVLKLREMNSEMDKMSAHLDAASIHREIVWGDSGLRRKVSEWWEDEERVEEREVESVGRRGLPDEKIKELAAKQKIDLGKLSEDCRKAGEMVWGEGETINAEILTRKRRMMEELVNASSSGARGSSQQEHASTPAES